MRRPHCTEDHPNGGARKTTRAVGASGVFRSSGSLSPADGTITPGFFRGGAVVSSVWNEAGASIDGSCETARDQAYATRQYGGCLTRPESAARPSFASSFRQIPTASSRASKPPRYSRYTQHDSSMNLLASWTNAAKESASIFRMMCARWT